MKDKSTLKHFFLMDQEEWSIPTGIVMMENGKTVSFMEMVLSLGKMALIIKDNTFKE